MSRDGCGSESDFFCEVCRRTCSGGSLERPVDCHVCDKECCLSCRVEDDDEYYCTRCYEYRFECVLCRQAVQEVNCIDITSIAYSDYERSPRLCRSCIDFAVQQCVKEGKTL